MSRPIPHTSGCGIDQTLDNKATLQTIATPEQPQMEIELQDTLKTTNKAMSNVQQDETKQHSTALIATVLPSVEAAKIETTDEVTSKPLDYPAMTPPDIGRYAVEAEAKYPNSDGAMLYQTAQIVPLRLRPSFEAGLGPARTAYQAEVAQRGEPPEQPIPDILGVYLSLGFMFASALHKGYEQACLMGHKQEFWDALALRNERALESLKAMIAGRKLSGMVLVPRLPKYSNGQPKTP